LTAVASDDALGGATLVEADVFSENVAGMPLGARFGFGVRLAAASRVRIDNRHVAERAALGCDLRRGTGAVHEVVEIGQASRRHRRQGKRDLAVVH
jgi:hypothetical protein